MEAPKEKPRLPTDAELDILAVLWRLQATVREVHAALGKNKSYTTSLKQMPVEVLVIDHVERPTAN